MKKYFLFISFFLLAASCWHEKKITPEVDPAEVTTEEVLDSGSEKIYKGLFVVGKNILSFRKCSHPDQDLAVIDSTGQMKELYKSIFLHSPAFPYEYVYVEVKGEIIAAQDVSISRMVDSVIIVKDVLDFEQKNYMNACIPYDFWALGRNWSLQISQKEGIIVLKDYSAMKVEVFEYFIPKISSNDVFTYTSNNYATQSSIKVVLNHEPCSKDSMNHQFDYSAKVVVDGKQYYGCAIKGNATE